MTDVSYALLLTLIAGLAGALGGGMVFLNKSPSGGFIALSLGLSTGVMIYISTVEIYKKGVLALSSAYGEKGFFLALTAFIIGGGVIWLLGILFPEKADSGGIYALALALHNFPEGLATFTAALADPVLGLSVLVGLALHNIPEGCAIAFPLCAKGKSKMEAFLWSLFASLTEPLGAFLGWLVLMPVMSDTVMGLIFSFVAGIMCYLSIHELYPAAKEKSPAFASAGLILGMLVMGVGLIFAN